MELLKAPFFFFSFGEASKPIERCQAVYLLFFNRSPFKKSSFLPKMDLNLLNIDF